MEGLVSHWEILILPLLTLAYFEALRRLDRYWKKHTPLTDIDILWYHARQECVSEYEIFRRAAPRWSVGRTQIEEDFKIYLQEQHLPYYVRDYIRALRKDFKPPA
jgi:hypothetical protein